MNNQILTKNKNATRRLGIEALNEKLGTVGNG
jgi:hypothetical protein